MPASPMLPWVWVRCADYKCGHSRAVALVPWVIRWGVDDPGEHICRNFRCVMCGHRALIYRAGVQHDSKLYANFPDDPLRIGGARLVPEYWTAHSDRCAAIYESKRELWARFWSLPAVLAAFLDRRFLRRLDVM